eukprot:Clim_evm13s252 gene=Clim_evmTU13s252
MPSVEMANIKERFVAKFPDLVSVVMKDLEARFDIPEAGKAYLREIMEYNVPGGKMNRGISVAQAYQTISGASEDDPELEIAIILGWCVEWLQAFFLVADDLMDQSETRRGQLCWYKRPGVNLLAANDSLILEGAMYRILRHYIQDKPYYGKILELFLDVTYRTEIGQMMDLITAPEGDFRPNDFTDDRYFCIVIYKTAYYSFYLPVAIAMVMSGIDEKAAYESAEKILIEMGAFFQVQDDYLDCYGDPAVIGKIGTDIQDNKCGWLVVQALKICTPEQRKILEDNYAKKDPACVAKVKELYKELNLEALYRKYEEESYAKLQEFIKAKSSAVPDKVFTDFAQKIYKRDK